jgi:hypothetical protein
LLILGVGFLVKTQIVQADTDNVEVTPEEQTGAFVYNNNPYFNGVMDSGTRASGGGNALEQNVAELVKDGLYQAYCAATVERHTDFTPADYAAIKLDFTNAYMSLLRNKNGESARLSSTEAYFGYVKPLENEALQEHNIENNFYSNITTLTQQCVTRVQMLRAIWNVCESKEGGEPFVLREQCNTPDCLFNGENPGVVTSCDLYEEGRNLGDTTYDIKKLIEVLLRDKKIPSGCKTKTASTSGELVNDGLLLAEDCCHALVTSKADKSSEEGQVRDAMGSLPFYANDAYRIGYVLESAKLCQPCQFDQPTDNCNDEDSEIEYTSGCAPELKWSPDRLRSYQMLLPNVVTNAHTNKPEYNYIDPSHFAYQAVTTQGSVPKDWVATGQSECEAGVNNKPTSDLAQQDTDWQTTCHDKWDTLNGDSSYDNLEPINRRLYRNDTSEKSTLALLVNKTATNNTFNTR